MHRLSRIVAAVLSAALVFAVTPSPASAAVSPEQFESVSFADAQRGMLSGGFGNQTGFVSMTDDGGVNWRSVRVDPNLWFRASAMGEGSSSFVTADLYGGDSYATTDLAGSWTQGPLGTGTGLTLYGADMENATRGWVVGRSTHNGNPGVIFTTNDAGGSWAKTYEGPFYTSADPEVDPPPANAYFRGVDGADANTAWAVGKRPWGSVSYVLIQKTVNGGASWTTQTVSGDVGTLGEVYAVSAPSASYAYACGAADRIYYTSNGGSTWAVKAFGTLTKVFYDISMASTSTGWAVGSGGRIYKTTDGWATRVLQGSVPVTLRSVHAIDADRAWVVGDNEYILGTTDGGNSWQGNWGDRAPSAVISAPATGTVLTGVSASITGSSTDGVGVGVATVSVSVQRDDARWWNGASWQSTQAWLDASSDDWFESWSYAWALEPGQNRERTYSLAWRAVDAVANAGASGAVVTGIKVDNAGPALLSAYQVDATHVRAVFSETLDAGAVDAGAFDVTPGLSVATASVVTSAPAEVLIETTAQASGQTYTLTVGAGAVEDLYGNAGSAGSDAFTAQTGVTPFLTVSQSTAPGRPESASYVAVPETRVVDGIVLAAHDGTVTVTQVSVSASASVPGDFDTDVTRCALYLDDGDGEFDAGDTLRGTEQGPLGASWVVTLDSALAVAEASPRSLWVVYLLDAGAGDGNAVGSVVSSVGVQAPATVDPFAPIASASGGHTLLIDSALPSVAISAPAASALLTGPSATISGTAADSASGLASLRVRIARDDGLYWSGSAWVAPVTWVAVAEGPTWSYDWALDPGQSGEHTYDITAEASDAVGRTRTASVTGVRVDNTAPELVSVAAFDATHVDVAFSERVATATVSSADFIAAGLTLSGAVLQPGGTTVRLTVTGALAGVRYALGVNADGVEDAAGNGSPAAGGSFVAAGAGRESGATRYDTAIAISQATYLSGECTNAVLATGESFPDALSASGLAGAAGGPLLLTRGAALSSGVATELARLGVTKVWIVGGTGAISPSVVASLAAIGYETERVFAADRYGTSAAIAAKAAELQGASFAGTAFLARGDDFADALAVSPASAANGFPVLLTRTSSLPTQTAAAVTSLGITDVVISGGTGAVAGSVAADVAALGPTVTREFGANRYATAAEVAGRCVDEGWLDGSFAGVATGKSFADALGGGVSAGAKRGVLLLTDPNTLSPDTSAYISAHPALSAVVVFGGTGAVVNAVLAQIAALL